MKKLPILFVLVLAAQAFTTVSVQIQNGVVVGCAQGKGTTIREYIDNVVDYNLTSNPVSRGVLGILNPTSQDELAASIVTRWKVDYGPARLAACHPCRAVSSIPSVSA